MIGENSSENSYMHTLPGKTGYVCKINKRILLGSGSFGNVHPGYLKSPDGKKIDVAVKIV